MTAQTDEEYVTAIRDAVNKLAAVCKAAKRHGLTITLETREDDDDDVPVVDAWISREWSA